MMHPRRFVWIWMVLAAILIALLALAMLASPATAHPADPAGFSAIAIPVVAAHGAFGWLLWPVQHSV